MSLQKTGRGVQSWMRKTLLSIFWNYFICHFWARVIFPCLRGTENFWVMRWLYFPGLFQISAFDYKSTLTKLTQHLKLSMTLLLIPPHFTKVTFFPIVAVPKSLWVATSGTEVKIKINYPTLQMLEGKNYIRFSMFQIKCNKSVLKTKTGNKLLYISKL